MSKTINFVYGCSVFNTKPENTKPEDRCITISDIPKACPYCYAKAKFSTRPEMNGHFHIPTFYGDKIIEEIQSVKTPEIYVGSIMGDFLSPHITNDNLVHLFTSLENSPQHLVMLLSKNPARYVNFMENVWKRELPSNVWYGTSVENEFYTKRIDYLRRLKELSPNIKIWVEVEPILGMHTKTDFTGVSHVSISLLGEDQIYTDKNGKNFSSYFREEWVQSIFDNSTIDNKLLSVYEKITYRCRSMEIKNHVNHNMYHELHKQNGLNKNNDKEDHIFESMW